MSVPRIDGSGCGYWLTPRAIYAEHPGMTDESHLAGQAITASWPTPKGSPSGPDFARTNREGSGGDDLATRVARGGATRQTWGTPTSRDHKDTGTMENVPENALLGRQVLNRYATPRAEDSQCAGRRHNRDTSDTLYAQTVTDTKATPGSLNPTWVEWLMGWPRGWTDCEHLATVRCLSAWRRRSRTWLSALGY